MFRKARKISLSLRDKVTEKLEQMVRHVIPEKPGGVIIASPVVWQRKNSGELKLCVYLKVHIKDQVLDEDYPIPDLETIFHNLPGAPYFGKTDLSDVYYQIEIDEEAKNICTINTSPGLFKMCRLPQGLGNASSIFRSCINSKLKRIKGVLIFQHNMLVNGITMEQFNNIMLAVKSQVREKNFN